MTSARAGWERRSLSEVARLGSGGTPRARDPRYYGGQIPWAVIGDLDDGPISTTATRITDAGLAESSAKLVPVGAVLIAMYGSIGKLAITQVEMATNQAIAFAVPDPAVLDARFLFHYMRSQREALAGVGKGATQQNISQTILRSWPVPIPALSEQRRIVEILEDHLSRLDAAATLLRTAASRSSSLWQSAVEGQLTGAGIAGERRAHPGLADEGVDDGALARLPPGWAWRRLGDLADVVGGVTKDASRQSDASFVAMPYLRVANVQRGFLDLGTVTTIRVPEATVSKLRLVAGDVLLNEGGDRDKLGRGWVWEGQIDDCIHQNHVFRARVRDGSIDPYLLSWAANSIGGRWCERNGRQSVNLASISLSKIKLMPVPVPPLGEQSAIVGRLAALLDAGDNLRRGLSVAALRGATLRRSLLVAAFSGRLTADVPVAS